MNFYELFEKKEDKDHQQDVTIADPKAALALKQARARYTYAKSDLEAFVKMVQDDEEKDQEEFEKIEAELTSTEDEVKDLEAKERQTDQNISKLEQENELQDKHIQTLNAKETAYEKKIDAMTRAENEYKSQIERLQKSLNDLETRVAKSIKGFKPVQHKFTRLPNPEELEKEVPYTAGLL